MENKKVKDQDLKAQVESKEELEELDLDDLEKVSGGYAQKMELMSSYDAHKYPKG